VQHARGADGRTVAQVVLDAVRAENAVGGAGRAGAGGQDAPMGSFGVVVGATVGALGALGALGARGAVAPQLDVGGPILAPGLGAQGAAPADLRAVFGPALPRVLPSASREVLQAGVAGGLAGRRRAEALRAAVDRLLDAVTAAEPAAWRSV
jgi:orotidine-5'-phosphate decarboxylase